MSTIRTNTLLAADGTTTTEPSIPALDQRMAKAWVNFKGTGTVAIRSSYNVSSITDSGTGDYTTNFAVAMANTNYAASSNVEPTVSNGGSDTYISSLATTSCRLNHFEVGTRRDGYPCNVIVMGGS